VVDGPRQHISRSAYDPWDVATGVDDRVPAAAFQRVEAAVPIAAQRLYVGEDIGVVLPTIEQRHLMVAGQCRFDEVAADEHGSAQDE